MFGIGANELIIILLFGFLIFGPDKMPAMAKTIGKAIAKFRTAQEEMNNVIKNEVYDPNSEDPFSNPLDALSKVEKKVTREDRGESFTERKARYDKQRAAQKAAKEKAEAAGSAAAGAAVGSTAVKGGEDKHLKGIAESKEALDRVRAAQAKKAAEGGDAEAADAKADGAKDAGTDAAMGDAASAASTADATVDAATADTEEKKTPTADELYGVKPRARKPHTQKVPARKPIAPISAKEVDKQPEEAIDADAAEAAVDATSTDAAAAATTDAASGTDTTDTPSEGKGE